MGVRTDIMYDSPHICKRPANAILMQLMQHPTNMGWEQIICIIHPIAHMQMSRLRIGRKIMILDHYLLPLDWLLSGVQQFFVTLKYVAPKNYHRCNISWTHILTILWRFMNCSSYANYDPTCVTAVLTPFNQYLPFILVIQVIYCNAFWKWNKIVQKYPFWENLLFPARKWKWSIPLKRFNFSSSGHSCAQHPCIRSCPTPLVIFKVQVMVLELRVGTNMMHGQWSGHTCVKMQV